MGLEIKGLGDQKSWKSKVSEIKSPWRSKVPGDQKSLEIKSPWRSKVSEIICPWRSKVPEIICPWRSKVPEIICPWRSNVPKWVGDQMSLEIKCQRSKVREIKRPPMTLRSKIRDQNSGDQKSGDHLRLNLSMTVDLLISGTRGR